MVLLVGFMSISLVIFGQLDLYRSIFSAIITFFISFLGNTIIEYVLMIANPRLVSFFNGSILGGIVGSAIEILFPLLAFLFFPRLSLRLPLKESGEPYDLYDIVVPLTLGCMFYAINSVWVKVYTDFLNNSKGIVSNIKDLLIVAFGVGGGVIIILMAMKKKYDLLKKHHREQLEEERSHHEEQQRINKEKIAALNNQNIELAKLNKRLEALTVKPQQLIDEMAGLIKQNLELTAQLQEYHDSLSDLVILKPDKLLPYNLTANEKLVLEGIMEGKTFQEIADSAYLVEGSVRNIAQKLYRKFEVKNKDELVRFVAENMMNDTE
jgi:DNA-binding NarL/FixJ family response regulator